MASCGILRRICRGGWRQWHQYCQSPPFPGHCVQASLPYVPLKNPGWPGPRYIPRTLLPWDVHASGGAYALIRGCRASKLCSGVYRVRRRVVIVATMLAIVSDGRRVGALRTPGARAPCASGRAPFWVQVHAAGLAIILRVCPYLPCGAGCARTPGATRRSNGQTTVRILVLPGFRERPAGLRPRQLHPHGD